MFNGEVIVAGIGILVVAIYFVFLGGYEGRTIVGQAESYDFRCNAWLPIPALSLPRSALYLQTFDGLDKCKKFLNMEDVYSRNSDQ